MKYFNLILGIHSMRTSHASRYSSFKINNGAVNISLSISSNVSTPLSNNKNYTKYKVVLSASEEELIFIKSTKSDRWWMKIPYPPSKKIKYQRHHLVPCSYKDYEIALKDEMPDLWIKTYNKINIKE